MVKRDLKKELEYLYLPSAKEVVQVDVPSMNFLMVDGKGDPNTSVAFSEAAEALFSLSYAMKFMVRKSPLSIDYGVMPLEGLWWAEDMSQFSAEDKSKWKWTLMIMQPDFISEEMARKAIEEVRKKKHLPVLSRIRFEAFTEGRCAQVLHIGPFSEEGPIVEKVHAFINSRGRMTGKHHEIYLSDIRRAAPEKWKTVLRQPYE